MTHMRFTKNLLWEQGARFLLYLLPFAAISLFPSQLYLSININAYLTLHNISELFSIAVSFAIFSVGWYSYNQNRNSHTLFLAVTFLGVGLLDFLHTLSFPGMPSFITPNSTNKGAQFWIIARLFSASMFMASAFISPGASGRIVNKHLLLGALFVFCLLALYVVAITPAHFPDMFIEGQGLTRFKNYSEYLIMILLLASYLLYIKRYAKNNTPPDLAYASAFLLCAFAELSFTAYKSAFDSYNFIGHLYKVIAYVVIYRIVFAASVEKPYRLLTHSNAELATQIRTQLETSNELFRRNSILNGIFDSVPQSIFLKDREGRYISCNAAFVLDAGLKNPEQIVGKTDYDLLWPPQYVEKYRQDDTTVIESGTPKHHIIEQLRKSGGELIWVDTTKLPMFDNEGNIYGVLGVYEDVTSRLSYELKLKEAKEAAETATKAKSEFLANMSHEIRTPLNGVLGMLQLISTTPLNEEQMEYLQNAIRSSKRLTKLLSDILDLSMIESGKVIIVNKEFPIESISESILSTFTLAAKEKGIALAVIIDQCIPPVVIGDEIRLHQILLNLVGNAIKFTNSGQTTLEVVSLMSGNNRKFRLLFIVTDTGVGIADDAMQLIFEPFAQVEGSYTRRFQGAGLGLSIVRRLVGLMGGCVTIDSTPGQGTSVYLSLPFTLPNHDAGQNAQPPHVRLPDTALPARVLLAEDDPVSALACERLLAANGFTVVTAKDGREMLRLLAAQDFDLILMDVQMPIMNGVEATRAIREDANLGAKSEIPIIAMTAYAMLGDKERFLAAGMNAYIAKPVDIADLRAIIELVMVKRDAFAPAPRRPL
jgi:PAS domain S-box-containing protein